jgi:hypothetical protein
LKISNGGDTTATSQTGFTAAQTEATAQGKVDYDAYNAEQKAYYDEATGGNSTLLGAFFMLLLTVLLL